MFAVEFKVDTFVPYSTALIGSLLAWNAGLIKTPLDYPIFQPYPCNAFKLTQVMRDEHSILKDGRTAGKL